MGTLTPDEKKRALEILFEALARPEGEREAFIRTACRDHEGVCAEAMQLLRHERQASAAEFLEHLPSRPGAMHPETARLHAASTASRGDRAEPAGERGGEQSSGPGFAHEAARFEIVRRYAVGGLGEVYLAVDRQFGREVALKEIRKEYAAQSSSQERFLREAEITGRLEHPSIVPVYGLGRHADGRPYYVMRLIKGESLREAISTYHGNHGAGLLEVGERALELRRLLGRFIDVCQAVHYAHSRGVIHRDIKPSNIMLGAFGETLVVDWGLAKSVGRPDHLAGISSGATLKPRSGDGEQTLHGVALGTPEYMSPEQASGWIDELGPATDIYSLGATLFHLLTGAPPIEAHSKQQLIEKVRRGEVRDARDVHEHAPRPLAAICAKAMSTQPHGRYPTAAALAGTSEQYLADEPVAARPEHWLQRMSRWGRKHRAWVRAGVAALSFAALAATAAALMLNQSRQENDGLRRQETAARAKAEVALAEAETARAEAEAARAEAVEAHEETLRTTARLAELYMDAGSVADALPLYKEALKRQQAVLGENHLATLSTMTTLAIAYDWNQQGNQAVSLYEDIYSRTRAVHGDDHRATLTALRRLAGGYRKSGRAQHAVDLCRKLLERQQATLGADDRDTLWGMRELAMALEKLGRNEEALKLYEEAVAGLRANLGDAHRDTIRVMEQLARVYQAAGQPQVAARWRSRITAAQAAAANPTAQPPEPK